jgi:hypothetical protein
MNSHSLTIRLCCKSYDLQRPLLSQVWLGCSPAQASGTVVQLTLHGYISHVVYVPCTSQNMCVVQRQFVGADADASSFTLAAWLVL